MTNDNSLLKNRPIAVFDSGVGGISVLKELIKQMPDEDYIYFGDTGNAPYGSKDHGFIHDLTLRNAAMLVNSGIKALVVACNTATSIAINDLRKIYSDIAVIGVEPAIKPAVLQKEHPTVVVMATPATLSEGKYVALTERYKNKAEIIPLPCPRLAGMIEKGIVSGKELDDYLIELFAPLKGRNIDSIVLGCTHYPFIRGEIERMFDENVTLFNGAQGTAAHTRHVLEEQGLLRTDNSGGNITLAASGDKKEFEELFYKLFKMNI